MKTSLFTIAIFSFILPIIFSPAVFSQNWPAWRNDGRGIAKNANPVHHWNDSTNIRWRAGIPGRGHSSASQQLIHHSFHELTGYNPENGQEIWKLPLTGDRAILSPVIWKDFVMIGTGGSAPPNNFIGVRVSETNNRLSPEILWEQKKTIPQISSPVAMDSNIYAVTKRGILTCRDIKTGIVKWKERLSQGTYYASITAANDVLFISNLNGETNVIKTGEAPEVLAINSLPEPIYASIAISQSDIFIRTENALYCIGESQ